MTGFYITIHHNLKLKKLPEIFLYIVMSGCFLLSATFSVNANTVLLQYLQLFLNDNQIG